MSTPDSFGGAASNFGLVGDSPELRRVLRTIHKLRRDRSPVLITGESGVGKELVARALHQTSPLAEKVFLAVDSASLVGSLMESELFGHLKGAFTGAHESKTGLVRAADGGTLFLDEIGELPNEIQAKLLRVLQEGEVRPIGATRATKVRVRVLAATNRDLAEEVRAKRFRNDLYYRLNVISLRLPSLRQRRQDIPVLTRHFLEKYALMRVALEPSAMEVMVGYDWPGNVRELENAIRRMVALSSKPTIGIADFPTGLRNFAIGNGRRIDEEGAILPVAEVERRHILKAVDHTKGDLTSAALLLGIGRTTLYRKLNAYRREAGRADRSSGPRFGGDSDYGDGSGSDAAELAG